VTTASANWIHWTSWSTNTADSITTEDGPNFSNLLRRTKDLRDLHSTRLSLQVYFRRERGDDSFKARITAQRVVPRHQFQIAIVDAARELGSAGKLFAGQVLVTYPCSDSSKTNDHRRAAARISFHGKKRDGATTFTQRFVFSAKAGVGQTKNARRSGPIGICANQFLLFRAGGSKAARAGSHSSAEWKVASIFCSPIPAAPISIFSRLLK
jgi:hypothetical protein